MKCALIAIVGAVLLLPQVCAAAQLVGTVRAADQFVPGATVTARQGDKKITAFTDENGRYSLDLPTGTWSVDVEMFGFTPLHEQIQAGDQAIVREWTLDMPRIDQPTAKTQQPAASSNGQRGNRQRAGNSNPNWQRNRPNWGGNGGPPGRQQGQQNGQQQGPGFQNAQVRAAENSQDTLSLAASNAASPDLAASADAEESLLVNGSTSGGLAQASDDETRRQRMMNAGGPNGGPGGGGFGGPT